MDRRTSLEASLASTPNQYGVFKAFGQNLAYAVPDSYNIWGGVQTPIGPKGQENENSSLHARANLIVNPSLADENFFGGDLQPVHQTPDQVAYAMNLQKYYDFPRSYSGFLIFDSLENSVSINGPPGIEELSMEELRVHPLPSFFAQPINETPEGLEKFDRNSELKYRVSGIPDRVEESSEPDYNDAGDGSGIPGGVPGVEWEDIVEAVDETFEE